MQSMALKKGGLCCPCVGGFSIAPIRHAGPNESNQSCVALRPGLWLIKLCTTM